ncbi:hypothetical protein BOO71_0001270 [Deinococcus marmoris]|uniref:Uncharacterized protein n=1 Tax=Deinococcus marmoris TaxID=249408 RepID=A0A1U7P3Y0_9DEIO|nr:hypothetical protein BOO71_0001270 [Deinococcus marmoris]
MCARRPRKLLEVSREAGASQPHSVSRLGAGIGGLNAG